ncbi:hypothetical protein CEP54_002010 [Fusarium duplospermum]|uniref:Uncharacterized protein n=1 Tax=Fusarium duplospermum TaxID=1325734 RepID=A0A428QX64_9HYPO|nr:hypothetical protein CEP54_002010 [Fusarium duplospermum]
MEGEDEALACTAVGSAPVNVLPCMGSCDGNSDEDDSENESEQSPFLAWSILQANLLFTPLLQDLPFLDQRLLICMAAYEDSIDAQLTPRMHLVLRRIPLRATRDPAPHYVRTMTER